MGLDRVPSPACPALGRQPGRIRTFTLQVSRSCPSLPPRVVAAEARREGIRWSPGAVPALEKGESHRQEE